MKEILRIAGDTLQEAELALQGRSEREARYKREYTRHSEEEEKLEEEMEEL